MKVELTLPPISSLNMKKDWIVKLKKIAESNYNIGFGWQSFVECYDEKDWIEFVENVSSFEEAEERMKTVALNREERYREAMNEIF